MAKYSLADRLSKNNTLYQAAVAAARKKEQEEKEKKYESETTAQRLARIIAEGNGPRKVGSDPAEISWYAKSGQAKNAKAQTVAAAATARGNNAVDISARVQEMLGRPAIKGQDAMVRKQATARARKAVENGEIPVQDQAWWDRIATGLEKMDPKSGWNTSTTLPTYGDAEKKLDMSGKLDAAYRKGSVPVMAPVKKEEPQERVSYEEFKTADMNMGVRMEEEKIASRLVELGGKKNLTGEEKEELAGLKNQWGYMADAFGGAENWLETIRQEKKSYEPVILAYNQQGGDPDRAERKANIEGQLPGYEEALSYNGFDPEEWKGAARQQEFENDMLLKLYDARAKGIKPASPKSVIEKPINLNVMIAQLEQSTADRQARYADNWDQWQKGMVADQQADLAKISQLEEEEARLKAEDERGNFHKIKALHNEIEELKAQTVSRQDAALEVQPDFVRRSVARPEYAEKDNDYWLVNWEEMMAQNPTSNPWGYRGAEDMEQLYERLLAADAPYNVKLFWLTDGERARYNYYYDYDQERGTQEAQAYLQRLDNRLTYRQHEYSAARAYELGKNSPAMALVANALLMPLDLMGTIQTGINWAARRDTNPYGGAFAPFVARTMGTEGGKSAYSTEFGKTAYDVLKGMGEVGTAWMTGPFGKILFAGAASTAQGYDALNRGGSTDEALLEEGVAGTLEYFLEGTMDRLGDMVKLGKETGKGFKEIATRMLKGFLTESAEEMPGNLVNTLVDRWIMGADSQWETDRREKHMSNRELWQQLGESMKEEGFMGGLTGGILGGAGYGVSRAQASRIARDIQKKTPSVSPEMAQSVAEQLTGLKEKDPEELGNFSALVEESQALGKVADPFDAPALVKSIDAAGQLPVDRVTGIADLKDDQLTVTLEGGGTAKLDDVVFDDLEMRDAYRAAAGQPDAHSARAFLTSWQDSGLPVSAFERGFEQAYKQGREMGGMHGQSALNAQARRTAYNAGTAYQKNVEAVLDTPKEVAEAIQERLLKMPRVLTEGYTGAVLQTRTARLNPMQAVQVALLDEYGKRNGVSYVVVDTIDNGKANGWYKDGVIYVAADAVEGNLTRAATHEGWHYLKETLGAESAGIKSMEKLVLSRLTAQKGYDLNARIAQIQAAYKQSFAQELDEAEAIEEIVADSLFDVFTKKENLKALMDENMSAAQKFVEWVKRFARQMRQAMRRIRMRSPEARAMWEQNQEAMKKGLNDADSIIEAYNMLMEDAKEKRANQEAQKAEQEGRKEAASVKYSAKDTVNDEETMSIKEQIRANMNQLNGIEPVADIMISDDIIKDKKRLRKWVVDLLAPTGFKVDRQGFGVIEFNEKSINNSMNYTKETGELCAFAALPKVLKRGIQIGEHKNHKYRSFDTITFAAPVVINGNRGNMAVVVKVMGRNLYKTHRILLPDGSRFEFIDNEKAEPSPAGGVAVSGSYAQPISSAKTSIAESMEKGNGKYSLQSELTDTQEFKSADPVTYDDNGEVIPLDERFSNGSDDIRYSLKDTRAANLDEALMENAALRKSLNQVQELLASNQDRVVNDPKAIRDLAAKLIEQTQSTYNEALLSKNLRDIYNGLSNARDTFDHRAAVEDMADLARAVIEKSVRMDNNLAEEYADLRKELRTTNISLTESQIAEAAKLYGSYEDFRRQYMGRLRLTKPENGINLTSKWQELSEQYPEFFPADTNEGDMISRLADVVEALKPTYSNIYGQNMGEAAYDLAMDMWQGFLEVPQLTSQQKKTIAQLRNDLAELQREHRDTTWKFKQMSQKYAEQENRIANMANQRRINQEKLQAKAEITRIVKSLSKQLLKPTNQQHIPKRMRGVTAELLATIDFKTNMTGEKVSKILEDLHTQYLAAAAEADNDETNEGYTFDEDVADLMESAALITKDGKKPLSEMGLEELQTVRDALRAMRHIVADANELFVDAKKRTATAAGDDTIATLNSWRGKNESRFAAIRAAGDMLQRGLIKPTYFFEQLKGTPLYDAWVNIRKGEGQHTRQMAQAENYLRQIMKETGYDPKGWKLEEELKFSDEWRLMEEAKVKEAKRPMLVMNRGELMMLYATAKREKNTGTQHLEKGGVEFESQRYAKKEKNARFQLNYDTVMALAEGNLTKEQRAYVDRLVEYLSTVCAAQGNVVSNRMYGIDKFKEKYYVPFKTAGNYLKSDPAAGADSRLSTGSFTKNLTEKARTPLTIKDFTEVWCEHVEKMSSYAAFALPLEDFNRIYNSKGTLDENAPSDQSVKASIAYALGQRGKGYIDVFLKDLNGNNRNPLGSATALNRLTSLAKGTSIGFNLSVAVQQMSAGVRAYGMIDGKYVAAGMAKGINYPKSYRELKQYAPIAVQKEWGYFDTNMSRSLYERVEGSTHKGITKQKISDWAGWLPQQGDRINWAQIWEAVKLETADMYKDEFEKGSEAHLKKAGERFTEVIDHTQVADSVFQRAEWARSKDGLTKALISFMSEPITQYNMLWSAANKFARAKGMDKGPAKAALIKSGRKMVSAVITSMVFNSALQALAAALRDRENEKKEKDEDGKDVIVGVKTYGDKWKDAFIDNMISAPLSMLPYVSDIASMIEGFEPSRLDMQVLSKLVKAGTYWWDVISGKKELDAWKGIYNIADAISYATGMPISNVMRDGYAAYQTGYEAINAGLLPGTAWDKGKTVKERLKAAEANYVMKKVEGDKRKVKTEVYYDLLLQAWYEGGPESADFGAVLKTMTGQGATSNTIYSGFKKRLAETEELVAQGANALDAEDYAAYEKAYTGLVNKDIPLNMALEMIKSAVPKEETVTDAEEELKAAIKKFTTGDEKKGVAGTAYGYTDLINAMESGNDANRDRVLDTFEKAGIKESSIRSQVTQEYRKRYLAALNGGDTKEANRIKKLLMASGLDYDEEDFTTWWEDDAFERLYEAVENGQIGEAKKIRQSVATRTGDDDAAWNRITSYYARKYKDLYKKDYKAAIQLKGRLIQLGVYESTIKKWERQANEKK